MENRKLRAALEEVTKQYYDELKRQYAEEDAELLALAYILEEIGVYIRETAPVVQYEVLIGELKAAINSEYAPLKVLLLHKEKRDA